jgi:hypothetical protein
MYSLSRSQRSCIGIGDPTHYVHGTGSRIGLLLRLTPMKPQKMSGMEAAGVPVGQVLFI